MVPLGYMLPLKWKECVLKEGYHFFMKKITLIYAKSTIKVGKMLYTFGLEWDILKSTTKSNIDMY